MESNINLYHILEPGYYEEHKFGIRIADIIHVIELPNATHYFKNSSAYQFTDITLVPIQTKLVDVELLTDYEVI